MKPTIFAPALGMLWECIEDYGLDPEPFFREAQIDPGLRHDPNARVAYEKIDRMRADMAERLGDPCVGLKCGKVRHPSYGGALGYAWLTSSTLRTGLQRLSRYLRVLTDAGELELQERAEGLTVVVSFKQPSRNAQVRDSAALAFIVALSRANSGDALSPLAVDVSHPKPSCAADYYGYFRCPIRFEAPGNELTFATGDVDRPLPGANPKLAQLNDHFLVQYLADLDKADAVSRTRAVILDQLASGGVSDESVAEALYMNVRSLQRKLQAEGTTFKAVLNEVRQDLADKYIRDQSLSLSEIAFLLGFAEISSFSRAFKRWTGASPSAYREDTAS